MVLANEPSTSRQLPSGTVTFLFTDIEGSTRLWEDHREPMRQALVRHDAILTELIGCHSGVVVRERGEGDSFFAVFARASDAILAALAIQRALRLERWPTPRPLKVRIAIHTGEADLRDGGYYGTEVNRCARLRALTRGGQTLVSQASAELIRRSPLHDIALSPVRPQRLKDLRYPEQPYELLPAVDALWPVIRRTARSMAHRVAHSPVGGAMVTGALAMLAVLVIVVLGRVEGLSIVPRRAPRVQTDTAEGPTAPPPQPGVRYWTFSAGTKVADPRGIELRLIAADPMPAVGDVTKLVLEISNPSDEIRELVLDTDPFFSVSVMKIHRGGQNSVYATDTSFGFKDQSVRLSPHGTARKTIAVDWRIPPIEREDQVGRPTYRIDVAVWSESRVDLSLPLIARER